MTMNIHSSGGIILNEIPIEVINRLDQSNASVSSDSISFCQVGLASCSYMQLNASKNRILVNNTVPVALENIIVISLPGGFRRPTYLTALAAGI